LINSPRWRSRGIWIFDRCVAASAPTRLTQVGSAELRIGRAELGCHCEQFGIAPKEYLRAQRLIGVRRALREGSPGEAVIARVAADFGFWHGSQFAAEYRRLFGELPSETLTKATSLPIPRSRGLTGM